MQDTYKEIDCLFLNFMSTVKTTMKKYKIMIVILSTKIGAMENHNSHKNPKL